MKDFNEYLEKGIVKKVTSDKQRAENLMQESDSKYDFLNKMIEKMGIDDNTANNFIEFCYNIIIYRIRAIMLEQGFSSSGFGAHEAEVAFAAKLGFSERDVRILDQLRYFRNGILYYAKKFDKEYAEKIINFTREIIKRLKWQN
ncbi:hypothetical protein D6777_01765 [Candidatus Woesearchaeota archaeon]|nr:MAG: hypothetical protein D6777_01765 [Candidatus Woesearchaeota archaeon]